MSFGAEADRGRGEPGVVPWDPPGEGLPLVEDWRMASSHASSVHPPDEADACCPGEVVF